MNEVLVVTDSYLEHPALDSAVSHAVLDSVAGGDLDSVFRIHVPGRVLAFGMADRIHAGYGDAIRIAAAHGFAPIERLAGGRAAVFHEKTLSFSWATREDDARTGIKDRFQMISGLLCDAFRSLKIDARVGEVPGEYCPGEFSVNVGGKVKVMGVGQRLVKGAAHIGGVIVVDDAASIRDVLVPVYRALHIDWDPRTTGALADRSAGTDSDDVVAAVLRKLGGTTDIVRGSLPEETIGKARDLIDRHVPRAA